jgi:hypothetical protein
MWEFAVAADAAAAAAVEFARRRVMWGEVGEKDDAAAEEDGGSTEVSISACVSAGMGAFAALPTSATTAAGVAPPPFPALPPFSHIDFRFCPLRFGERAPAVGEKGVSFPLIAGV